jgi:hypothetical protein
VADIITEDDLPSSITVDELVETMIAGANAKASRVAPCLTWDGTVEDEPVPSADQLAEAKLVLVGAVKRWVEAGSGALQSENVGPFGYTVDTRQRVGYNLWPSEINQLQEICASGAESSSGAFSFSPSRGTNAAHADICAINFGANYCSCGADIAGYPLYELSDTDAY